MKRAALLLALAAVIATGCSSTNSLELPARAAKVTEAPPTTAIVGPNPCGANDNGTKSRPATSLTLPTTTFMNDVRSRRLRVGVSPDTLLFGAINPLNNNRFEGFDIEIAREIAFAIYGGDRSKIDDHIEFRSVTNAQRIPFIQGDEVDMVAHTFTINCTRRQSIDFSDVYFLAGQQLLVIKGSGINSINDLKDKRVCAPLGTTSLAQITDPKIVTNGLPVALPQKDETDCLVALQNGQVDAVTTDNTVLAGMARQDPFTEVVGTTFSDEPYGIGISLAHPEFTGFVNAVIQQMKANGRWLAIYKEFDLDQILKDVPATPPPPFTAPKR